jgi:hypothetical protein
MFPAAQMFVQERDAGDAPTHHGNSWETQRTIDL